MSDYPLIGDHGLIGDLQTAALVASDGSIDWFCFPRFDSPSVFGSLLDNDKGGRFRIGPAGGGFATKQIYLPDTAILITRFLDEHGVGEVVDFMPVSGATATDRHRLVRLVRCVRGTMTFEFELAPRFDYSRQQHQLEVHDNGAVFRSKDFSMTLHAVREPDDARIMEVSVHGDDVYGSLTLQAGQLRGVVLDTFAEGPPREFRVAEVQQLHQDTEHFWKGWLSHSTYQGRWREALQRSAITLKLMTYAPTGALVAAPTTGLPEQVGGERNWDYRFTWVRDGSFSIYALLRMGFTEEAKAFGQWLLARVKEHAGTKSPLNLMYRIDGSSDLTEETLEHWEGYRGSYPVRIGNGASSSYSSTSTVRHSTAFTSVTCWASRSAIKAGGDDGDARLAGRQLGPAGGGHLGDRGGPKDFTYGRVMSCVAFYRAIRLATEHGRPAPLDRWMSARDAIFEQVMTRGWNADRQAFVQHYEDTVLDSSNLRMSTVGFIAPQDSMWMSTLRAMDEELVSDSLVYRYNPSASPDGLRGSEGTFSLCTFMYVDALARAGRLEDARLTFEKMLTYANHLGLFSEEIGSTGEQLGNFPQAFTHPALIDAAITLNDRLDEAARGQH
jgi:GH15 family glucan-1,4-alpha-glucosidase